MRRAAASASIPSALDLLPGRNHELRRWAANGDQRTFAAHRRHDLLSCRRRRRRGRRSISGSASSAACPIAVLVHGRHGGTTSHLGYDYLQRQLAQMGIVAASVDCNASDQWGGWADNIRDRADLVIASIAAPPVARRRRRSDLRRPHRLHAARR